ncbi:MAG: hypothetical protein NXH85_16540 [Pseudomonadaceae bacterium]|nr:hypothetical protein [Pseudomonadaceae bacterium]
MKTLGTVALTIVGVLIAFFAFTMWATSPITKTADAFFDAWNQGQPQESYGYLSQQFTQTTSAQQLHKFMNDHRLNRGVDPSWSRRSIVNNTGTLKGELARTDGSISPIDISLVQEHGAWKILGFNLTIPPPQVASNSAYAPTSQYNGGQAWNRSSATEAPTANVDIALSVGVPMDEADRQ